MRRSARALTAIIAVASASGGARAQAQDSECEFDVELNLVVCYITAPPDPGRSQPVGEGVPLVWERTPAVGPCPLREYTDPNSGNLVVVEGTHWWVRILNTETGEVVSEYTTCQYPGEPPPQPPPRPPTPGEWRDAVADVLKLETSFNPPVEFGGITGLDTWFWCTDPGTIAVPPITVRGWTVEATVEPVQFSWSVAGPGIGGSHTADGCGAEPSVEEGSGAGVAWIWKPETMGTYSIQFSTTWGGSWTLSYGGATTGTFVLDPLTVDAASVSYSVDEFVGVLTRE